MRLKNKIARAALDEYERDKREGLRDVMPRKDEFGGEIKDMRIEQIKMIKGNGQRLEHFKLGSLAKSPSGSVFSGVVIENNKEVAKILYETTHASGSFEIYEINRKITRCGRYECRGDEEIIIDGVKGTAEDWIHAANKFEAFKIN